MIGVENRRVPKVPLAYKQRKMASEKFKTTLMTAVKELESYRIHIIDSKQNFKKLKITNKQRPNESTYTVTLKETPTCDPCPQLAKFKDQVCKHILMCLLQLGFKAEDNIMFQRSYDSAQLNAITLKNLTSVQEARATASKYVNDNTRRKHAFYLAKLDKTGKPGKPSQCAGCKVQFEKICLVLEIDGRYKQGTFSGPKTFRYHVSDSCMAKRYALSDLPRNMPVDRVYNVDCTDAEVAEARSRIQARILPA